MEDLELRPEHFTRGDYDNPIGAALLYYTCRPSKSHFHFVLLTVQKPTDNPTKFSEYSLSYGINKSIDSIIESADQVVGCKVDAIDLGVIPSGHVSPHHDLTIFQPVAVQYLELLASAQNQKDPNKPYLFEHDVGIFKDLCDRYIQSHQSGDTADQQTVLEILNPFLIDLGKAFPNLAERLVDLRVSLAVSDIKHLRRVCDECFGLVSNAIYRRLEEQAIQREDLEAAGRYHQRLKTLAPESPKSS